MPQIARNGDNLFGTGFNLTNGAQGINPIDPPGFGDTSTAGPGLPADYLTFGATCPRVRRSRASSSSTGPRLVLLLFTCFCSVRLRDSRLGRAWIAIREDETAAAAMGVPLMRTKTWAYAAGAFFGGIAGAYYASFKAAPSPTTSSSTSRSSSSAWSSSAGWATSGACSSAAAFLAYLNQEGLGNIGAWINETLRAMPRFTSTCRCTSSGSSA